LPQSLISRALYGASMPLGSAGVLASVAERLAQLQSGR
jgi:hypothetical protein